MHPKLVGALRPDGERQTLEFKASLNERREIIQTAVAFANAQGGDIFVGVRPDGRPCGVDIGERTLEQFANLMGQHIYPPLPVYIDQVELPDCPKPLIWIEVPRDVPPVVGAYLVSELPIARDQPVVTDKLQAYRRVGRTNQKVDFMWLRPSLPTDPRLFIAWNNQTVGLNNVLAEFTVLLWAERGAATARDVALRTEPEVAICTHRSDFLPGADNSHSIRPPFRIVVDTTVSTGFKVVASCMDDWGCRWEFWRDFEIVSDGRNANVRDLVGYGRRIAEFPALIGSGLM